MALINRMSRLFTADVHAVLDRIEEPEALLKHAIREMEEAIERDELRLRQLTAERETLAERQRKVRSLLDQLTEQLDVCFAEGNEDLARKTLKRRLEAERLEQHAAERRALVEKELETRRAELGERREHLDVVRQKAELLATAPVAAGDWDKRDFAVGDDEVEVALLRERQKRSRS